MLKLYRIDGDGRVVRVEEEENAQIFCYSHFRSQEDHLPLIRNFKIEAHMVRSALDAEEIARFETHEDYSALICKRPRHSEKTSSPEETGKNVSQERFRITSLGMFFFKDRLVVVYDEQIDPEDFHVLNFPLQDVRDVGLALIYHTTLHFYETFRKIQEQVGKIEKTLFGSTTDRQLMEIFDLEKSMIRYLSTLGGNNALLVRLLHAPDAFGFSKKQVAFLRNLMIDSNQCYRQAEVASEIMASLTDTSASLVNNKLNLLMKRLTIISLIFLPINAIAGIGGMSEFTAAAEKIGVSMGWAYVLLSAGMLAVAYLTWFLIHRIDEA